MSGVVALGALFALVLRSLTFGRWLGAAADLPAGFRRLPVGGVQRGDRVGRRIAVSGRRQVGGRERVAGAGGVDDRDGYGRAVQQPVAVRPERAVSARLDDGLAELTTEQPRRVGRIATRRSAPSLRRHWRTAARRRRSTRMNSSAPAAASGAADAASTEICRSGDPGQRQGHEGGVARAAEQRVARHVQVLVRARSHAGSTSVAARRRVRARVGDHRPLAVRVDQHDAGPGRPIRIDLDPVDDAGRRQLRARMRRRRHRRRPARPRRPARRASRASRRCSPPTRRRRSVIGAWVSEPRASGPGSVATMSTMMSPRQTIERGQLAGRLRRTRPRSRPASRALLSTRATLAASAAPSVCALKYPSRNGVTSLPLISARPRRPDRRPGCGRAAPGRAGRHASIGIGEQQAEVVRAHGGRGRAGSRRSRRPTRPARGPGNRSRPGRSRGSCRCGSRARRC